MQRGKSGLINLLFVLSVVFGITLILKVEAKAEVLQVLPTPENGWTRYDDTNSLIKYYGKFMDDDTYEDDWVTYKNESEYYLGTKTWSSVTGAACRFTVNGKSFRIIGEIQEDGGFYKRYNTHDIYVDGKNVSSYIVNHSSEKINKVVVYEYTFDNPGVHTVELVVNNTAKKAAVDTVIIDAIDVLGSLEEESKYFGKTDPVLVMETPKFDIQKSAYFFNVSGYALNVSGVKSVNAVLDDKTTFTGTIGLKRSDEETLKSMYPGYPNTGTSGYNIDCNLSEADIGVHKMTVKVTGINNTTIEKTLYIRITNNYGDKDAEVIYNKVPFYRYNNAKNDHMYTIEPEKINDSSGYNQENNGYPIGYVYAFQESGTIPLYQYYSEGLGDHFYTTNKNELGNGNSAYAYNGIACYVYDKQVEGTIGLYRYYNTTTGDHLYSAGKNELGDGAAGYVIENGGRPECYIMLN